MCKRKIEICGGCRKSHYDVSMFETCIEHIKDRNRSNKICLGITTHQIKSNCTDCKDKSPNHYFIEPYFFTSWQ